MSDYVKKNNFFEGPSDISLCPVIYIVENIRQIPNSLIFFLDCLEGGTTLDVNAKKLMCYPSQSMKSSKLFTHYGVMFYLGFSLLLGC